MTWYDLSSSKKKIKLSLYHYNSSLTSSGWIITLLAKMQINERDCFMATLDVPDLSNNSLACIDYFPSFVFASVLLTPPLFYQSSCRHPTPPRELPFRPIVAFFVTLVCWVLYPTPTQYTQPDLHLHYTLIYRLLHLI